VSVVEMTFELPLTVTIDVDSGELRFELGDVTDPATPALIAVDGKVAVTEGLLDEEDKQVANDPRVVRAFALLAGPAAGGEPPWDWWHGVAEAANAGLSRLVTARRPG
jgi:hypothetical protein